MANRTVLATSEERRRRISEGWTTCTSKVGTFRSPPHRGRSLTPLSAALGIAEEVEALGLRGTKKKKGKKLDEDFMVRPSSFPLSCRP